MQKLCTHILLCLFALFSLAAVAQNVLPSADAFRMQNVATGEFLTAATGSSQPVTMSSTGDGTDKQWTFVVSGSYYNIDSQSESGGTGILRAPGAGFSGGAYRIVSTLKSPPAGDTDKTWTIAYDGTTDTYRFQSRTANRYLYLNADGTVTHTEAPSTDDRSNWRLVPLMDDPTTGTGTGTGGTGTPNATTAPDEDLNLDLSCPASGDFRNDNTREVDIASPVNVGKADDRTCYADYSESMAYGLTWGVYNITDGSNHWDAPGTLQPRIERSLPRSQEVGIGSYARFTGTLRILEVGDTDGTNNDGTYIMQTKGKHTGGGGPPDPAICLYLAKPVYGDDGNGNQVQVSFNIEREQINFRGGSGAGGRTIVFLKNVAKDALVDIELEVGFREDPDNPGSKVHYSDIVIGGDAFNWNIPEPERGLESGIRYGAYRVKGGRAQTRWANTTYEMVEVVEPVDPVTVNPDVVLLRNVETGEFLTAGPASTQPVTMSASGGAPNTLWTLVQNGEYYNIDSESETGGTGVLRAPGAGFSGGAYRIISTLKAPPTGDTDKTWTIHYDAATDTYRFESRTAGRFLYQNPDGTITHSRVDATDNRSVWEVLPASAQLPLDFMSFSAQNTKAGVQLDWEIANQVDNDHFEILKSRDGRTFQRIGRVEDEEGQNYYQFMDPQVTGQTSYYQLKQVDIDGRFSFSNVISIASDAASLVLYPNPVRQNEDFTIESEEGYLIFDAKGTLLRGGAEKTIKMDLPRGIYFLKQNNSAEIKKFVVY